MNVHFVFFYTQTFMDPGPLWQISTTNKRVKYIFGEVNTLLFYTSYIPFVWIQNKNFILIYPLKEDYLIITHNFKHILWTGQTFSYLPQLDEQQKLNSYYKNHTHYLIHLPSLVRCWQFILGQMFKVISY